MIESFPLDQITRQLEKWGCDIEEIDNGIAWELKSGRSTIIIDPVSTKSIEGGLILGVVRYVHTLVPAYAEVVDNRSSAILNQLSSLSSLIPGVDGTSPTIVSRVTLYRGDEEMWALRYAPMLCTEAYMQPNALLNELQQWKLKPEQFGLSDFNNSTPFAAKDFDSAKDWCDSWGLVSNSSDDGFTAELPWDRGALSSMFVGFSESAADEEEENQYR